MKKSPAAPSTDADKLLVRGLHLDLTHALHAYATEKVGRLLRRNRGIIRIRTDLEYDATAAVGSQFIAKGRIEITGPDLVAAAASDGAYKSIDLLAEKLDRMLHRRAGRRKERRHPAVPDGLSGALPAND